jgi:hypothetical protein
MLGLKSKMSTFKIQREINNDTQEPLLTWCGIIRTLANDEDFGKHVVFILYSGVYFSQLGRECHAIIFN